MYLNMTMSHLYLSSPQPSMALRLHSPLLTTQFKYDKYCIFKGETEAKVSKRFICRSIHMESGHSEEPKRISFDNLLRKTKVVWDNTPKPVKEFPWNRAFSNFIQLVLDLTIAVVKFLFVPILVVTSISEMSYCAHERKLALVPFPLVIGVVVASIIQESALKSSDRLKVVEKKHLNQEAEVPWHLIAMLMFFTLIKLPGPYYPYWGRLFIPHFANGVLLRALWSMFFWYKKTRNTSENPLQETTQ